MEGCTLHAHDHLVTSTFSCWIGRQHKSSGRACMVWWCFAWFLLLHWRPAFSEMNMCTCNIMIYWNVVTCRLYKRNMHDINDIWLEYMSSTKHHKEQIKEMTEVMKLWHKKQDMFWRLSWVYYQKILADSGSCWHRDKFFIVDSLDRLRRALLAGLWNSSASLLHTV